MNATGIPVYIGVDDWFFYSSEADIVFILRVLFIRGWGLHILLVLLEVGC